MVENVKILPEGKLKLVLTLLDFEFLCFARLDKISVFLSVLNCGVAGDIGGIEIKALVGPCNSPVIGCRQKLSSGTNSSKIKLTAFIGCYKFIQSGA